MEFVNDTNIKARFDYYDVDGIQQQLTLQPFDTVLVSNVDLPGNIAVTLFDSNNQQAWATLHGVLTIDSIVAGVIEGNNEEPKLDII
ncbi:hypothetical protein [Kistimonas asteriae]|uniref:hypothetical protein n=1 Tax=Kistimonas asteriae TaxID=517724 RepID=UPI001BA8B439|nr:hypothetical protein [Kistimonas asteriae]